MQRRQITLYRVKSPLTVPYRRFDRTFDAFPVKAERFAPAVSPARAGG
jgi:hypothetical protein